METYRAAQCTGWFAKSPPLSLARDKLVCSRHTFARLNARYYFCGRLSLNFRLWRRSSPTEDWSEGIVRRLMCCSEGREDNHECMHTLARERWLDNRTQAGLFTADTRWCSWPFCQLGRFSPQSHMYNYSNRYHLISTFAGQILHFKLQVLKNRCPLLWHLLCTPFHAYWRGDSPVSILSPLYYPMIIMCGNMSVPR